MDRPPVDPQWPRLISLAVHEFRTPMTVVAGYIRMLLKDRAGPVTEQQRKLLEEAEKSSARLSALLAELSELGAFEKGTATFNRSTVDLRAVLRDSLTVLPDLQDREVQLDIEIEEGPAPLQGDPVRLKSALASLVHGLRREIVGSSKLFVREAVRSDGGRPVSWITMGDANHIETLPAAAEDALVPFDEFRGGCGLSLAIARRIINAHSGSVWSPSTGVKTAAVVVLPLDA
jgi:signal transduction histidine kinase